MKIINLGEEHQALYFECLEDWCEEMKEACTHKKEWYEKTKDKGLGVKLAVDDRGEVGGMIQYLPIEESFVDGERLYFVLCIWVHGYKQGRGNFQKRGMGKALLAAAEDDARRLGAEGMAAWGIWLPFWMKASWFKKKGYRKADRDSMRVLMWKPFEDDAKPPRWVRQQRKPPIFPGKVTVTSFINGWCPAQNIVFERAKRACSEFGDKVKFEAIDTSRRDVFFDWGISDGLFINGREVRTGPPPSYEKIRKLIAKQAKRF